VSDKSFLVKVKLVASPGWEATIHQFADSFLAAERSAKSEYARQQGVSSTDIDAKAIREDEKTVWKHK